MALNNYANLKAAIVRLDGSNSISNILDDAILLAETEMYNHETDPLRMKAFHKRATSSASTSSRFLALPDDFLESRGMRLVLSSGNQDIRYATPESLEVKSGAGKPRYFTVTSQYEFDRTPDSAYTVEVSYFERPTGLSSSNTTNVILTNNPNIYLFGCLWAVNLYNAEEDKAEYYYNQFLRSIKGANKADKRARYGPAPTMKFEGMTP